MGQNGGGGGCLAVDKINFFISYNSKVKKL